MRVAQAFIDANLLVLLVVSALGKGAITKHKRTRMFSLEEYNRLCAIVQALDRVLVTPNTLTEASNLLLPSRDPRLASLLRRLVEDAEDLAVDSETAVRNAAFPRLGLADAVLMEVVSEDTPLITVDVELYRAAIAKGERFAFDLRNMKSGQAASLVRGSRSGYATGDKWNETKRRRWRERMPATCSPTKRRTAA